MKKLCVLLSCSFILVFLSGCWDYSEIEDNTIVNIIALDRDEKTKDYILSIESMDVQGLSQGVDISPHIIEARGPLIIEAVSNLVSITTKIPYWRHATVLIVSQDIASEGLEPILDWIARSPELQLTLRIFVSMEKTAKEILEGSQRLTLIRLFEFEGISGRSLKLLAKLPDIKINEVINEVQSKELNTVLPTVEIVDISEESFSKFTGSAYFEEGKMKGFFSPMDTMKYLFVMNQIKSGPLLIPLDGEKVALTIYRNTTRVNIDTIDNTIEVTISVKPTVNISEINGVTDYINKEGRKILKEKADLYLENEIKSFIEGVQKNSGIDVFNFGSLIKKRNPNLWKRIGKDWEQIFKEVSIKVDSDIKIKSSQLIARPIGADTND